MEYLKKISWKQILVLAAGFVLAMSLLRYLLPDSYYQLLFSYVLTPLTLMLSGVVLVNTGALKKREFQILFGLLIWACISVVLNSSRGASLMDNQDELIAYAAAIFLCFGLGYALTPDQSKKAIRVFAKLSVWFFAAATLLSLICAATGQYIPSPFRAYGFGIHPGFSRLVIFSHPNTTGIVLLLCSILTVYLIYGEKRCYKQIAYSVLLIVFYFGIGLSDCRSAKISYGFTAALLIVYFMMPKIRKHGFNRRILYVVGALLLLVALILAFSAATKTINSIATRVHDGAAEETQIRLGVDRKLGASVLTLNLRTKIWSSVAEGITFEPEILCAGVTPAYRRAFFEKWAEGLAPDAHNTYIHAILCFGVLAVALEIWFLLTLFRRCWSLCFGNRSRTIEETAFGIQAIAIASLMPITLVETILFFADGLFFGNIWFFLLAGLIFQITDPDLKMIDQKLE